MRPFSSAFAVAATSVGIVLVACVGDDPVSPTPTPDASTSSSSGNASSSGGSSGTTSADACAVTCNGQCVDTQTDPANCGGCGTSCQRDSGTFACVAGKCGHPIVSVAAGTYSGCVLLLEGSVWCWGSRDTGVTGEPASSSPTPSPRRVGGLSDITQVAVGHEHACARRKDGTVLCWGANGRLQTGSPSNATDCTGTNTAFCHVPRVVPFPAGVKIAQISAGGNVTCARTEGAGGDVYCWGQNGSKLVSPAVDDTNDAQPPTRVASTIFSLDVAEVRVGYHDGGGTFRQHACALKTDKTVWCWGTNNFGQLGHAGGDTTCAASGTGGSVTCNPVPQPVVVPSGGSTVNLANVKSVHAMSDATCTLKEDKTVWCWGSRFYGQSGLTTGNLETPQQVSGLGTTELFEARGFGAWAKDSLGNVKGWGEMGYLSVGNGATAPGGCNDSTCYPTPMTIPGLTNVDQISGGLLTGLALRGQEVVGWGRNTYATLGHPRNTNGDVACPSVSADTCNGTPVKVTDLP